MSGPDQAAPSDPPATPRPRSRPPSFGGTGAAGRAWQATLALCAGAFLLIAVALAAVVTVETGGLGDQRGWSILALFGIGWFLGVAALVAWAIATGLAAAGLGALPRPVLALGGIAFAGGAVLAALAFPSTSEPIAVGAVLLACLGGFAASLVAWRRR